MSNIGNKNDLISMKDTIKKLNEIHLDDSTFKI